MSCSEPTYLDPSSAAFDTAICNCIILYVASHGFLRFSLRSATAMSCVRLETEIQSLDDGHLESKLMKVTIEPYEAVYVLRGLVGNSRGGQMTAKVLVC